MPVSQHVPLLLHQLTESFDGRGSPNIEMDEHTFLTNRERAVDYLNSLDKVFVNDQFLNWDPENRIKVRIISARAYHSLFMHNMYICQVTVISLQ